MPDTATDASAATTPALQRVPATAPLETITGILDRDGGLIVESIFAPELIARMRAAIDEAATNFAPGAATQGLGEAGKAFVGSNTIRFSSLGKLTPAYFEVLDNPLYRAIADAVLLPNCGSYWVNTGQAMLIGPESPAQMLHRDCDNWPQVARANWPDGPEVTLSAMIALEPISEELGATRVIPGSHKWPDFEDHGTPEMSEPAVMAPGDALIYSGKLVHGGGANQTQDRWRRAMHLSYVLGWLVPEESNPLDYTDADLEQQSDHVKQVLGHKSYAPHSRVGGGLWLRHVKEF